MRDHQSVTSSPRQVSSISARLSTHQLFLVAIVILSQAGLLIRAADANALAICFWRMLLACGVLIPLALARGSIRGWARLTATEWCILILSGLFLFVHFYTFFRAVQETTVAAATLLFCLNPLSTALAARLLTGVRLTPNQWLAIALGLSSVLTLKFDFLVGPAAGSGSTGVAMGLISAATFSGYFITGQSIRKKLGNLGYTSVVYSITVVCSAVALGASGEPFLGWTTPTWLAFVALAVFPTLLGHALMTHCLPSLNINWASTMTLIEPVLAAVTASWIFGESISSGFALASALGLAAVWVLFRGVNT